MIPAVSRCAPLLLLLSGLVAGPGGETAFAASVPPGGSEGAPPEAQEAATAPGRVEMDAGAALQWPTDAGRCVTGSFCEFRPDHFHSGVDISTWGQVGYRCLAMADGEIDRVRVSCGGYGRALYLHLADGRTAVYAHLSRFAGALEDSVRALQTRSGRAYFDTEFAPRTFPVHRGDLLAYTGQSGVGVPHLHVELRDPEGRPLDPLRSGLAVADTTPPWIARVALTPLTPLSSVDGRSDTVILDVHPGEESGVGRLPRTLPVEGEIGLSVEVDETTDACRFHLAPARLELREGDELLYAVDYRTFSFDETERMDEQIDPRFSYGKVGRFHLLWRREGNDLSFLEPGPSGGLRSDGVLRANQVDERSLVIGAKQTGAAGRAVATRMSVQEPGARVRQLTVVAFDAAGNRGRCAVPLSFAAPPQVRALTAQLVRSDVAPGDTLPADGFGLGQAWQDTVEVHGAIGRGGRRVEAVELEWSPDAGSTWFDAPPLLPELDDAFHARIGMGQRVPGTGREGVLVRARVVDELGAAGVARSVAVEEGAPPDTPLSAPEVVTLGGWTEARFPDTTAWQAASGGWEPCHVGAPPDSLAAVVVRSFGRGIRIVLPARAGGSGKRTWGGMGGPWAGIDPWGRPVPLTFDVPVTFAPGEPRPVHATDGHARADLAAGSFRETCALTLRPEPPSVRPVPELRSLGPLYFLETGAVPPGDPWRLTLHPVDDAADPSHVGLFVQDGDRFRYIGGDRAPGGGWSAESRSLLGVGLFEDRAAPVLGPVRLERHHGRWNLRFLAKDAGAGIDCDDVEVRLDGVPIVHELDDETGDVVAYPGDRESGQAGTFELRAMDRCGNVSQHISTVRFP